MASTSPLTPSFSLMLLFLTRGGLTGLLLTHAAQFALDPPEDLKVSDPGRLGYLDITWSPPSSLVNVTQCQIQYQLEYFNPFGNTWAALRTTRKTYSAQFDPSKDVMVRAYTLAKGPCTDGVLRRSENYTELIQKAPSTGIAGTEAKEFTCMFQNMERVECTWTRSLRTPADSQQNLFFWYKALEQAVECPKYILSAGVRSGCLFSRNSLVEFSDIIFCVNGSSSEGPLKPVFASLQIQNHIKPAATEKLDLQAGSDGQLELLWENPVTRLPGYCLEWEVEHIHEGPDGKITMRTVETKETKLTVPTTLHMERNCFQVRSKLSTYCVDETLWSDWSNEVCHSEKEEAAPELKPDPAPVCIYVAIAVIALLIVCLSVWAAIKMKKTEPEKKLGSRLASLFAKTSTYAAGKVFSGKQTCTDAII
ncbi:interleukin-13 receptor subunit alpha-2 [Kryptolebias marmoratus]|uniref:Interleukin 13 receptor, alpha 2 n=1 Tax=Kryptolebias marmoratus TaxID=37003 RepID=A0A3Q3AP04_KRYMA|nr:interleukin-13 receptor subunit alpha-2 [Kryptolebias marmoratus]